MRGNELKNHGVKDAIILPDSRVIQMSFCFDAFATAEEIYNEVFKKDIDFCGIINDLYNNLSSAVQALLYGAIAVIDTGISFKAFLEEVYSDESKMFLHMVVVENLNKTFRRREAHFDDDDDGDDEFQWDTYYKNALAVGLTDADFWASTPKKIWLLTRDKEVAERQEWLTQNYV